MHLATGTIIASNYKLGKPMGSLGVCGKVYEGTDVKNLENVAIKVENQLGIWLANEARIYNKLNGVEGIPKMIWHGKELNKNILIIQRLGFTISEIIKQNDYRPFSIETALQFAMKLVKVIRAIHSRNIIHGDIHTGNVMMGTEENSNIVYLIDFGFAKVFDDIATSSTSQFSRKQDLTDAGVIFQKLIQGLSKNVVLPKEFVNYMNHCHQLQVDETPGFDYLENILGNQLNSFVL